MKHFAGLDWGSVEHAACVIDEQGAVVARLDAQHTTEGLEKLLTQLARIAPPAELAVAIARPSGLVVDTLVEAGHPVVPIHPNALLAFCPRYRAAGGKSDPGDAYILADVLRTDGHRFRPLRPASDVVRALRAMVRTRDDLVAERVALANQLRAQLDSFWPAARRLRRHRLAHRARLHRALPHAVERTRPRPQAGGRLPGPQHLLRPPLA